MKPGVWPTYVKLYDFKNRRLKKASCSLYQNTSYTVSSYQYQKSITRRHKVFSWAGVVYTDRGNCWWRRWAGSLVHSPRVVDKWKTRPCFHTPCHQHSVTARHLRTRPRLRPQHWTRIEQVHYRTDTFITHTQLEASTHKSAKTPSSNVCVTCDLNLWPFDPKINGFPGLIVKHLHATFSDSSCIGLWDIVWKKQTDTQKSGGKNPPPATSIGVTNYNTCIMYIMSYQDELDVYPAY